MALKQLSATRCFGGSVKQFSHNSAVLNCEMKFAVFLPPSAAHTKVPVRDTEDNFVPDLPLILGLVLAVGIDLY